jgi:hypothetical protein
MNLKAEDYFLVLLRRDFTQGLQLLVYNLIKVTLVVIPPYLVQI